MLLHLDNSVYNSTFYNLDASKKLNFFFLSNLQNLLKNFKSKKKSVNTFFWGRLKQQNKFLFLKDKLIYTRIFPILRVRVFQAFFKRYYKFASNFLVFKTFKLRLMNKYLFYLNNIKKLHIKFLSLDPNNTKYYMGLFSLEILSRYYIYLGYNKINLNSYWKKYIFGEYFNISVINLNYTYSIFKLQNNILFKFYLKNLNFLKLLIFDSILSKKELFKNHNCYFSSNYFANSWYSGYLTNPLLRYEVKNKKNFFRSFKLGGVPALIFFTYISKELYSSFLNEFFLLKIPTFGLVDTNSSKEFIDYPILSNTKNKFSRIFYLKILSKLFLNVKLIQQKFWLSKLKNYYLGFIFRLKKYIKNKKIKLKKKNLSCLNILKKKKKILKTKLIKYKSKGGDEKKFAFWYKNILSKYLRKNKINNSPFLIKKNNFSNEKIFNFIGFFFRRFRFSFCRNLIRSNFHKSLTHAEFPITNSFLIKNIFYVFNFFHFFLLRRAKKIEFLRFFRLKKKLFVIFFKFLNKFFFKNFRICLKKNKFVSKLQNFPLKKIEKPKKKFFFKKKKKKWKK